MSPSRPSAPAGSTVVRATTRASVEIGGQIRDERLRRHLTLRELARRAKLSVSTVHDIEAGRSASIDSYSRIADALGLRLEITLADPRRRQVDTGRDLDIVHSAMAELEASRLGGHGHAIGVDEPYQHYQFAGRADLVAWDLAAAAMLHIENRTRFPDMQQMAGSWNAKRAYMPPQLAARVGLRRGWASVTHVMVALWSSEAVHSLRMRTTTFRAICPDSTDQFEAWWLGQPPSAGSTSSLVLLDPFAIGRQRQFVGLDDGLAVRPRHRGYFEVAERLRAR